MANMSYCRFRNTRRDFADCADSMHDKLGGEEAAARVSLVRAALDMLNELAESTDDAHDLLDLDDLLDSIEGGKCTWADVFGEHDDD